MANDYIGISTDNASIPLRIEEIKRAGGTGVLAIGTVEAASHLGPTSRVTDNRIIVNAVNVVLGSRTGNLHCGIEIINTGSPFVNSVMNGLELPNGQLLGNITNTASVNGSIDGVNCQSVGGTVSQPVVITSNGTVYSITVAGAAVNFQIVDP